MLNKIFKSLLLDHPRTGKTDVLMTLVVFVVVICGIKFLLDGVQINIAGHILNFGHTDSFSYGSLLSPVLGAHGYVDVRGSEISSNGRVDNPDLEG